MTLTERLLEEEVLMHVCVMRAREVGQEIEVHFWKY